MSQAYYVKTLNQFLIEDSEAIVGKLNIAIAADFSSLYTRSTTSWLNLIHILRHSLRQLISCRPEAKEWTILLEYEIPRLLRRIDVVILADDVIIVVEYKDDRKQYKLEDRRQVEDYALDLQDFHRESRNRIIVPVLLAPDAKDLDNKFSVIQERLVQPTLLCNKVNFHKIIATIYQECHRNESSFIDANKWNNSIYSPTPTIIQAAQAIFAGHRVENISKAGATNLNETTDYVHNVINDARANKRKVICFVTGVPGAGKTLVGLNLIHREELSRDINAAYFSGNGPLIKVLRAALVKDDKRLENLKRKSDALIPKSEKNASEKKIESKIQNLHKFIKDGRRDSAELFENVVVFDEAQRCWSAEHYYNQSKQNQSRTATDKRVEPVFKSEAELLFEIMDKQEWAVIVALVGNGQEINTGEGGIREWGKALEEKYRHWTIHISGELLYGDGGPVEQKLFDKIPQSMTIHTDRNLHLSVNQRSFKADKLNEWVNAVLDADSEMAEHYFDSLQKQYPIFITREIDTAKTWLKSLKRGNKRIGLLASSGAIRLRPFGINVKEEVNEVTWFLGDELNINSSDFLEVAATEFTIQGLEIDWSCVCWDADLRMENWKWAVRGFSGKKWGNTKDKDYIINTYRVLLTRAREGLVIWIPKGDTTDSTRSPEIYDGTYNFLVGCGATEI